MADFYKAFAEVCDAIGLWSWQSGPSKIWVVSDHPESEPDPGWSLLEDLSTGAAIGRDMVVNALRARGMVVEVTFFQNSVSVEIWGSTEDYPDNGLIAEVGHETYTEAIVTAATFVCRELRTGNG